MSATLAADTLRTPEAPKKSPYMGASSFTQGQRLYGRDVEAREVRNLLLSARAVLIHSISGAGKTSLIQACIIDEMETEGFKVASNLRLNEPQVGIGDGNRYLASLASSLGYQADDPLARALARGTFSLEDFLEEWKSHARVTPRQRVLLILDQFEEVFGDPSAETERQAFFRQLGTAMRSPGLYFLFSMREEFLGQVETYIPLFPHGLPRRYQLLPLNEPAARDAIRLPARSCRVEMEEAVIAALITDLRGVRVRQPDGTFARREGPYIEPLFLQIACDELWQRWRQRTAEKAADATIRTVDWAATDVDSALREYYTTRVRAVIEPGRSEGYIRDWIHKNLIVGEARSPIVANSREVEKISKWILQRLTASHLLRFEDRGETGWYELAHDRLVGAVIESNRAWFQNYPLYSLARSWHDASRNSSYLLSPLRYRKLRKKSSGSQVEEQFVLASYNRVKWVVLGAIAVGGIIFGVGYLFRLNQENYAWTQKGGAERLDLQNEIQARTHHEVVEEIREDFQLSIVPRRRPIPKEPEGYFENIRPAEQQVARTRLAARAGDPLARGRIRVEVQDSRLPEEARSLLQDLGYQFMGPENPKAYFANALTFGDSVPMEAVREVAYALWVGEHPVNRIRYFYIAPAAEDEQGMQPAGHETDWVIRLSYEDELNEWFPLSVPQIDKLFVPPNIRKRVSGE